MSYYIVLNGLLGSGKSTNSKKLAQVLGAKYIAMDDVLTENNLDRDSDLAMVPADRFIKALDIIMPYARQTLQKGQIVVFDGCFYHQETIDYLTNKLNFPNYVFTLKVPMDVCIEWDKGRKKTLGEDVAIAVYKLVSSNEFGIMIDAKDSLEETHKKIMSHLQKNNYYLVFGWIVYCSSWSIIILKNS